ncbi:mitochondrial protein C2orf69 homolog isoform X2 [Euwallacea similis]|uniref:mitochondrial protein C2orf69 homolog isoform X2 n=1 Tax=Euwallacea similis TaxID=1736056 RepID=UPI00344FA6DF
MKQIRKFSSGFSFCSRMATTRQNPLRLSAVLGFQERKNDIIYTQSLTTSIKSNPHIVVFFPGDVQDYIENMEAHRDSKYYKQWNLEDTALTLQNKFPGDHILVVKPSRMALKTFTCFQNFVKSNELGVPEHSDNYDSLRHLDCLIKEASERLKTCEESHGYGFEGLDLRIVGFSKGCVVLNQFLYEFCYYKNIKDQEITTLISKIRDMYWLDGGHSGGKNTWVGNHAILDTLCSLNINVHVHVSPYQIRDDRRPWIKKEEKSFRDYLSKHGCNIDRKVHFETVTPSILVHFDVLNVFKTASTEELVDKEPSLDDYIVAHFPNTFYYESKIN